MKRTFLFKTLIATFFILLAYGSGNSSSRDEVKLDTKEKAMDYLNKIGRYSDRLPYGKFKIAFNKNVIMYWDNLDEGWTDAEKTACYFTLKESVTYEMDYDENKNVEVKMWELEVSDKCWKTEIKSILRLHLSEDGYLYMNDCYQPNCIIGKGW